MEAGEKIKVLVSHLFREESGKLIAALSRMFGLEKLEMAEDIVQETFLEALHKWSYGELPDRPGAWLMQVSKYKAINAIKKDQRMTGLSSTSYFSFAGYIEQQVDLAFSEKEITDSQLRLLFLCCHPSLSDQNQIILTLQVLCGFSIEEIAASLLLKKETVKKSLYRSKQQLRSLRQSIETSFITSSCKRIAVVHRVIYLMFNEGYKTTRSKELINRDLCYEAMRLCKLLLKITRANSKGDSCALLALMFFNIARFPSRLSENGHVVLLKDQDRRKWNQTFIREGFWYLQNSRIADEVSKYHIEAAIAAVHCSAEEYRQTDWQKIVLYYDRLVQIDTSPMPAINRALAIGYLRNPGQGLKELDLLQYNPLVCHHYLFHASRGDLLFNLFCYEEAAESYRKALSEATSAFDRETLRNKIGNCQAKRL